MTPRERYLLTPGEFLARELPEGTPLAEVRRRLPEQYVLADEPTYERSPSHVDWVITLGEKDPRTGDSKVYARVCFEGASTREMRIPDTDGALAPVAYLGVAATGIWLGLWAVVGVLSKWARVRRQRREWEPND